MADIDNSLTLSILKEIRADLKQQQSLLLQLVELGQRHTRRFADIDDRFAEVDRRFATIERRINDLVPEMELMLKGELMGRLANFESRVDHRIDELAARLDDKTPPAA